MATDASHGKLMLEDAMDLLDFDGLPDFLDALPDVDPEILTDLAVRLPTATVGAVFGATDLSQLVGALLQLLIVLCGCLLLYRRRGLS